MATSLALPAAGGTVPIVRMVVNVPLEVDASRAAQNSKYVLALVAAVMLNNALSMSLNSPPR